MKRGSFNIMLEESLLEPILFSSLVINDFVAYCHNCCIQLYANDAHIYLLFPRVVMNDLIQSIKAELDRITLCSDSNN